MKVINRLSALVLAMVLASGCQPEKFDAMPAPGDVVGSLTGKWALKQVIQKDETAEIKNSPYVSMDITSLFPYTQYNLTLSAANSGGLSGDYTATPGASPKIINANTGKWLMDDLKNPKYISFINGTDTTKMQIGSYPTSFQASFKLRQTKVDVATGKLAITYDYEFVKQ